MHDTIARGADILGLGAGAVRKVGVDARFATRPEEVERLIRADLAAGVRPVAVVGTAGTTGTGSIDPLPALAEIARRHGVWFHVDAAYGGAAVLADDLRGLLAGIELADSVTVDAHKWLYTSASSGIVLVRDEQHLLEVWISLLAHGRAAYRPPGLPPGDAAEAYVDLLDERLLTELQLDGRVFPSSARVGERFALRACIVNFRTEADDVDALLDVAADLGARLDSELRPGT